MSNDSFAIPGIKMPSALAAEGIDPKTLLNGNQKESPEEIKKAATQFESLLVHQMMNSMWNTVPSKDSLLGSKEEEMYRDMFNQALSDNISQGQGIGIKAVIEKDLSKSVARKKS